MAKARIVPGLRAETRFADAAAVAVEVRCAEVFEHAAGVLDTSDIERVHDMRVATRRLRATLELFAACFPKKEHRELLNAVKRLADALGERRDPDVAIAALERIADGLSRAERPGIDGLVEELRQDQARGNEALARELESAREAQLGLRLHRLAMSARGQGRPTP